jgi:hypothetical protein
VHIVVSPGRCEPWTAKLCALSLCRLRLVRCGADHGGDLGFDERVVDGLGGLADAVIDDPYVLTR